MMMVKMPRSRVGECHYCNRIRELTRDHVVPKSKGGPDHLWNFVACCSPCNQQKADEEWREHCDDCIRIWRYFDYTYVYIMRNRKKEASA